MRQCLLVLFALLLSTSYFSLNRQVSEQEQTHSNTLDPIFEAAVSGRAVSPSWIAHVGGIGGDEAHSLRIGSNGDVYVTGRVCTSAGTCSAIFGNKTIFAGNDVFVARMTPDGAWKWVTTTESQDSNSQIHVEDLEILSDGSAVIGGYLQYDYKFGNAASWGPYSNPSRWDGFVARISANGVWNQSISIGEYHYDYVRDLAVDSNDRVIVTGTSYYSDDGGLRINFQQKFNNKCDYWINSAYVVVLNSDLDYIWGKPIAAHSTGGGWNSCHETQGYGVAVDSFNDIFLTGYFGYQIDLSPVSNISSGSWDTYVAKSTQFGTWQWVSHAGGLQDDYGYSVDIDGNGSAIVTGRDGAHSSYGTRIILPNSGPFVAKISTNGTWIWGMRPSRSSYTPIEVHVDTLGRIHSVGGDTATRVFPNGSEDWSVGLVSTISGIDSDANGTAYYSGHFNGNPSFEGKVLISNGSNDLFVWKRDPDLDGDGIPDRIDNCRLTHNPVQDDHDSDGSGDACDTDDDDDLVFDVDDRCPLGKTSWISANLTDWDGDGCNDNSEDNDDDDDGILDDDDSCNPMSSVGWFSATWNDHDRDGCLDVDEDSDDDDDGISDLLDSCPLGVIFWASNATSDHDGDGCNDDLEDDDDDNDLLSDLVDACPKGDLSWASTHLTDHDSDGCRDDGEDGDDDGDGAADQADSCARGIVGWTRWIIADHDGDGCRDLDEDPDDDNDLVTDLFDACPTGRTGWISTNLTDHDGDGCRDFDEDPDDDNDLVSDENDRCPKGAIQWRSGRMTDRDGDGCEDAGEDVDVDGDGINNTVDACPEGHADWTSSPALDHDGDGCHDTIEDADDDNDGTPDVQDTCPWGESGCIPTGSGGNVTIIHEAEQNDGPSTIVNYYNNSTTINQGDNITNEDNSTNTTSLIVTPIDNTSVTGKDLASDGESDSGQLTMWVWIAGASIAFLFLMGLVLGRRRPGEPESDLAAAAAKMASLPDQQDGGYSMPNPSMEASTIPRGTAPPPGARGTIGSDGFEWYEHPPGSGTHWHRPNSSAPWQPWQ